MFDFQRVYVYLEIWKLNIFLFEPKTCQRPKPRDMANLRTCQIVTCCLCSSTAAIWRQESTVKKIEKLDTWKLWGKHDFYRFITSEQNCFILLLRMHAKNHWSEAFIALSLCICRVYLHHIIMQYVNITRDICNMGLLFAILWFQTMEFEPFSREPGNMVRKWHVTWWLLLIRVLDDRDEVRTQ